MIKNSCDTIFPRKRKIKQSPSSYWFFIVTVFMPVTQSARLDPLAHSSSWTFIHHQFATDEIVRLGKPAALRRLISLHTPHFIDSENVCLESACLKTKRSKCTKAKISKVHYFCPFYNIAMFQYDTSFLSSTFLDIPKSLNLWFWGLQGLRIRVPGKLSSSFRFQVLDDLFNTVLENKKIIAEILTECHA